MGIIFDASSTLRPDGYSFTRGSANATRFNSSGVRVTMAADTERLEYDPNTLAFLGLRYERAATNYLLQSNDQEYSAWYKGNNTQITRIAGTALDGASTVLRFYSNAFGSTIARTPETSISGAAVSVWARSRTGAQQNYGFWDGGQNITGMTPASGHTRISYVADPSKSPNFDFYPASSDPLDLELNGTQLEATGVTTYIDTGAGAGSAVATRAADRMQWNLAPSATAITITFDDNSVQIISGLTGGQPYVLPTALNRSIIRTIADNAAALIIRRRPAILIAS